MKSAVFLVCTALVAPWVHRLAGQQQPFPQWRASQLQAFGLWEATPIVVVGSLTSVTELGVQKVDQLPRPVMQDLHTLYWCQGLFNAVAIVKGSLTADRRKYVWASVNPGCRPSHGDQASDEKSVTRIWFVREEGEILRPTFDGGANYFIKLYRNWAGRPDLPPPEKLGVLLLTPSAIAQSSSEFENTFWDYADIACSLLGKEVCAQRIRNLSTANGSIQRRVTCNYLRAQLGESCPPE